MAFVILLLLANLLVRILKLIKMDAFETPILFLIFNRPETTRLVWQEIKKIRPKYLFLAADGARFDDELSLVTEARNIVLRDIDWDCQLTTLLRDKNLGCKAAGISALNWFFDQVEEGIILEDDCLPSQSFFIYCRELLIKYRHYNQVMHISGNFFQKLPATSDSYYFSHIPHIWGWATWRRAWRFYDVNMVTFPSFKTSSAISNIFSSRSAQLFWLDVFTKNYQQLDNGWDFQWTYALFNSNGLSITPNINLVKNIGFGQGATHSTTVDSKLANLTLNNFHHLVHPNQITVNHRADSFVNRHNFGAAWPAYPSKRLLQKTIFFNLCKVIYHKIRSL